MSGLTDRKGNIPETLAETLYAQLINGERPAKAVADELQVRPGYLYDAANPDRDEVQFQARLIVPFCRATRSNGVVEFMAAQLGCVLTRIPTAMCGDDEIRARFMVAMKEFGDVSGEIEAALLTNNDIDDAEFLKIDRAILESIAALSEVRQAVRKKAGEGMKLTRAGLTFALHGNPVLRREDAAAYCGVSVDTFDRVLLRDTEHPFPKGIRITVGVVGWRQADLDKWLDERPTVAVAS